MIKSKPYYWITCDKCDKRCDYYEHSAWAEEWTAVEYAEADDWINPGECPDQPHRGPQGPNEDLAQCIKCMRISWSKRPAGQTFGLHSADCSLPADHESYCVGGGIGHEPAPIVRG